VFEKIASAFELDTHHRLLLVLMCEALDRGERARKVLEAQGLTYDRRGSPQPRPEIAICRDSAVIVARLLRELRLDAGVLDEHERPPRLPERQNGGA
jgi:hypothetical protein